jgi:acetone carboxylase gamma subunit
VPEIVELGQYAKREDRFPHTKVFHCSRCQTKFKLTVNDTDEAYYTVMFKREERGMQWDLTMENVQYIEFPCPGCGAEINCEAPAGWSLMFAKGHSPSDRMHERHSSSLGEQITATERDTRQFGDH